VTLLTFTKEKIPLTEMPYTGKLFRQEVGDNQWELEVSQTAKHLNRFLVLIITQISQH
jgi:hypothetical protein